MSLQKFRKIQPATSARAMSFAFGLALAAMVAPTLSSIAHADDTNPRRSMTVTGNGEVDAAPDIAYLDTGVVSEGKTAGEALAANTKAMQAIFDGLKGMKIAKEDIRTSQFSVSPVYAHPPQKPDGSRDEPTIRGYQVTNQVNVTVRKLPELGAILDKLVTLGSNRVDGIRFEIEDSEPLLDKAREAAVMDALRKAKLYAAASGVALGPVLNLSEAGGYQQPMYMKATAMRESADVPMAAGTQRLSASVSMTIGIE